MITEGLYTIGVVSQMTNLSERQIRYYEKQGLVRPARTPGGRRLFSKKDVSDLIRVKHLLAMGYSVAEIKARWGVDRPKPQETIESPYKTRATKGEDTYE
ncbi:MAG TPA: MerR family transcriptional regulator, partial [Clostridia bacterium]|nr:MerR family transcriptional regulator [Clostridia bacterium]